MLRERLYPRAVSLVAGRRRNPVVRGLSWAASAYLACYENVIYDPRVNGERQLLRLLAPFAPERVFDVGANAGHWATMALEELGRAEIHCWEIVPDTAVELERALAGEPRVRVNASGLSDHAGVVEIKYFPEFSEASGQVQVYEYDYELRSCPVGTGDDYCSERGIEHVDVLKIDVEGADLEVLRGFDGMLSNGGIDVIQFEYGRPNILARALLRDFYELLVAHGYDVGKLYPHGVEFRPYALEDEDFRGPNFVAVRAARADLVDALRSR